jgi:pimeloyl-ACP methyl ester carboxylesterase
MNATGFGDALARRAALARRPAPEGVSGPPLRYLLGELAGWLRRRELASFPRALRPQPVMLLPGFAAHPSRMARMERALSEAGHYPYPWGLGFNLGPTPENFAFLMRRVGSLARAHGEPVALVGWSLGGLFAREIARREPQHVAKVVTMGSPFSGDIRANHAWRTYELVTGHGADNPPIECDFATKPPVPTIALWSPRDGVVAPRAACGRRGERDRAVALRCTHLGFGGSPEVIAEVLRQLDRED